MNKYTCFWKQTKVEIKAQTPWEAMQEAAKKFKVTPKHVHEIAWVLDEVDGREITNLPLM
jgi:hypothetical protein